MAASRSRPEGNCPLRVVNVFPNSVGSRALENNSFQPKFQAAGKSAAKADGIVYAPPSLADETSQCRGWRVKTGCTLRGQGTPQVRFLIKFTGTSENNKSN